MSKQRSLPDFPQQLPALRKRHGLTQQALAERIGIHVWLSVSSAKENPR